VTKIILNKNFIQNTAKLALSEDLYPDGDITSNLVKNDKNIKTKLIANENALIAGIEFAKQTFYLIDSKIKFIVKKKEGSLIKKGDEVATIIGKARNILTGERVALNFLSHLSGIATKTNKFKKIVGSKTKICCTRKTIPNLRVIQKYAVKVGGGNNHRFNLSDEYLIKDNHIASSDIRTIVSLAIKDNKRKKITVEIDNLNQLRKIIGLKFHTVLFDNMSIKNLKKGVFLAKNHYETEASGNISFKNILQVSKTKVNRISIGSLTHSVKAIDFKLEI
jgi:nicotinate-nucleotide pyrophosphorylase (carboxylating)